MPRNLQTRVTGDTAGSTPGDRLTGVYGGLAAAVRGYIGFRLTGALGIPSTPITAALAVAEAMDSLSSTASALPPATVDPGARNASTYLLQPLDTELRTVTLTSPHPYPGTYTYNFDQDTTRSAFGPTWQLVDACVNWMWTNPGGDWIDSTGAEQGTNHWAVGASVAANGTEYSTTITTMAQYAQANGRWLAMIVAPTAGARTIAGRHTATPPRIEITYSDGTPAGTLACVTSAAISSSSSIPDTFGDASGNIATGSARIILEFERPAGVVASAVLKYTVVTHFGAAGGLSFNLANPPTSNTAGPTGVAASAGLWDANIEAVTGVLGAQRLVDSASESDFISTALMSGHNSEWSPEFWGGSADTAKLPYAAAHPTTGKPRWFNAKGTGSYGEISFVNSSYSGEGFAPLRTGLGAIRVQIPKNSGVDGVDGYVGPAVGTTGSIARLCGIPKDQMGVLRRLRTRFYVRWHLSRPLTTDDRRVVFSSGGSSSFLALSGKWGITGTHDCTLGGVSATSGGGWGWQMRLQYKLGVVGTAGPDEGKFLPGIHIKSDYYYKAIEGYQYATSGYYEQFGKVGGYGGAINYDEWHLVETDIKLNSVTSSGLGYVPDGHVRVWINDRLVMDDSDMAFVSLPLNPGVGPAVITPGANTGNGTCTSSATTSSGRDTSYQCIPETLTLTLTSPTSYTITGSFRGSYGVGTVGVLYSTSRHSLTVTAGATPFVAGDSFTVVYPPYVADPATSSLMTPMRELGFRDLWMNHFHGGLNDPPVDITTFYTGLAWADGDLVDHIGPMKLDPDPLPSWVPPAGEVATYTVGDGVLTNSFISQCAPWYDTWYYCRTVNDFSGGALNPHYGTWGAMLFYGGGHAGTNDNTVTALTLGASTMTFKRLSSPSPIFGTGTDTTTKGNNSFADFGAGTYLDGPTCRYTVDNQPAAIHSYGLLTILPPSVGGAAGSLFVPMLPAASRNTPASTASVSAFRMDFTAATQTAGAATWNYLGTHPTYPYGSALTSYTAMPAWAVYDEPYDRILYHTRNAFSPRWFNRATGTYVQGTGTAMNHGSYVVDTGTATLVRERNLWLFLDKTGPADANPGRLRIKWLPIDAAQPSWNNTNATLSTPLLLPDGWSAAAWCADAQGGAGRIIVGGVTGDTTAVYEIEIPATLTDTWTVTRAAFGASQSISWPINCTYGKWQYNAAAKSFIFLANASTAGTDTVKVYRPRGT